MTKSAGHKTNAMRILDAAGIGYKTYHFKANEALTGVEVARLLDLDPDYVFKTLVTQAKSGEHYVFMIPVAEELDLKKAAQAVGEKSVSMVRSKDLFGLTGYIHGGCSPLAMKKQFITAIDETVGLFDTIVFSAGIIGAQIEMKVNDLQNIMSLKNADITSDR